MGKMSWPERVLVVSAALLLAATAAVYLAVRSRRGRQVVEISRMDLPPLRINVNQAEWWEIAWLPTIGEAKAKALVAYRERHGPFRIIGELCRVPGISPAMVERIAPLITLDGQAGNVGLESADLPEDEENTQDAATDATEAESVLTADGF